ncbi:MAG TPA: hypothetical protein VGA99_09410 [bacterium]
MITRKLLFPILFAVSSFCYVQEPQYPYKQYEDRKEGIITNRRLVAGEKLVLVSAAIVNDEKAPAGKPQRYSLGFYLPNKSRLNVALREYNKSYKVELLQNDYPKGIFRYSWPAEIPTYYDIDLHGLHPLVRVSEPGSQKIVPVVLFFEQPQGARVNYRFGFIPSQDINVAEFNLYPSGVLEPIYSGTINDLAADKDFYINWPGITHQNRMAKSGLYTLVVTATFKPRPGTPAPTVTSKYEFYHGSNLFKSFAGKK